jgi:hypothetical protein
MTPHRAAAKAGRRIAAVALAALLAAMVGAAAAPDCAAKAKPKPAAPVANPANEALLKLPPAEQAARLADKVGDWCIGTQAFLMGVAASGPRAGSAYWSLQCADGRSFAIELDADGIGTAIDCRSYEQASFGKTKCFKKF